MLSNRHGSRQQVLKAIQKSNCVCPLSPASLKGFWRTWCLRIFQIWSWEDGGFSCCVYQSFFFLWSLSFTTVFILSFLFLPMIYTLNVCYMSSPLLRTAESEMHKRKLPTTRSLQICARRLANRLSETRMVTALMKGGNCNVNSRKGLNNSAWEKIGFWKASQRKWIFKCQTFSGDSPGRAS